MRKIAFADVLYAEVAEAWDLSVARLRHRTAKELPSNSLHLEFCMDHDFCEFKADEDWSAPRSPRQILQWWGDYRRAQSPDYFVQRTREVIEGGGQAKGWVISDCRFANEAAMVRELGGQIWQVTRPGVSAGATGHVSDTDGSQFAPDRVIANYGSLKTLQLALRDVMREVGC
ncbi:hypothetical protein [Delftia sp. HK171]|uniref:hypothetical protein n=1 Tax=Delftia sp. HK171 TaxID=1920191 RepID=UPI00114D690C|nr:hypothetical protein [Delftia sp. HK171]